MRRFRFLALMIASLLMAVPVTAAAGPASETLTVRFAGRSSRCNAPLELDARSGTMMVGLRAYASCIGATYRWEGYDTGKFWIEKVIQVKNGGLYPMVRRRAVFKLGSGMVEVLDNGRHAATFNMESSVGKTAQESSIHSGAPNIVPLRFVNDLFEIRTDYFAGDRVEGVTQGNSDWNGAVPPRWDRVRISDHLDLVGWDGRLAEPADGIPFLPSTWYRLKEMAPIIRNAVREAEAKDVPWSINWDSLSVMLWRDWSNRDGVEITGRFGRPSAILWYTDKNDAVRKAADLNGKFITLGGTAGVVGVGTGVVGATLLFLGPELATASAILLAVSGTSGGVAGIAALTYQLPAENLMTCMDMASNSAEGEDRPFVMGMMVTDTGEGVCVTERTL